MQDERVDNSVWSHSSELYNAEDVATTVEDSPSESSEEYILNPDYADDNFLESAVNNTNVYFEADCTIIGK